MVVNLLNLLCDLDNREFHIGSVFFLLNDTVGEFVDHIGNKRSVALR